ncbi:hypothetical protein QG37_06689 [Candidozyma auris]|uniref:Uncharacterized protein n=1 Tax=Candidozyma auris TaxID=498019 RepID=A0A0L0NSJ5_CANAR|nr:hypothetical protein QG37_06689 [[Candida] auris]
MTDVFRSNFEVGYILTKILVTKAERDSVNILKMIKTRTQFFKFIVCYLT